MELTMNERRTVITGMASRCQKASKKEGGKLLDEGVQMTG